MADEHHWDVVAESELIAAVDDAFAMTGRGLTQWPDPHPDRSPLPEEYSRLLDPAKWRILGARAQAWLLALAEVRVAAIEANPKVEWRVEAGPIITRVDGVHPVATGALELVVARSQIGDVADAGVVIGVGDPAICAGLFPDCGCDACDSGSQDELDRLDQCILGVVSGAFRRLSDGVREITVRGPDGWTASGGFSRGEVDKVLANRIGWHELSGPSWLNA
jgi:hypothetical protein